MSRPSITLKRGSRKSCLSAARLIVSSTSGRRKAAKSESKLSESRLGNWGADAGGADDATLETVAAAGANAGAAAGAAATSAFASSLRRDQRENEKRSGASFSFIAGVPRLLRDSARHRLRKAHCASPSCAARADNAPRRMHPTPRAADRESAPRRHVLPHRETAP